MPVDGPWSADQGGLLLSLLTESFAVRALVGSLAAGAFAAAVVHFDLVRSPGARRLVVVAPLLAAAAAVVASVASLDDAYLPQLWVATSATTTAAGSLLQLFGETFGLDRDRGVDLLVLCYGLVVTILLARRVAGVVAVRGLVGRARPADALLAARLGRLADGFGIRRPQLVLLDGCPGGAFARGRRRAVVAVDPVLVARLDDAELDGLLAHELAHVARRDTAVGALVAIVRAFAFFIPPVHLASRWLRREQEESADELASSVTQRPVALASSILKVWDRSAELRGQRGVEGLGVACAAVPSRSALALAGGGAVSRPGMSPALKALTARVERLIDDSATMTPWQRAVERVLVAGLLATATAAVIVIPGYVATELNTTALSVGYLSPSPSHTVEAPAFATFRALAPEVSASDLRPAAGIATGSGTSASALRGCPCVESQAQLRRGVPAGPPAPAAGLQWRSTSHEPWQVSRPDDGTVQARPLWTLNDSGPQVGVYLVGTEAR